MRSIYFEIYEDLRDRIEAGEFVYGGFIPSEAVLVEDYECSHNTLRKSLSVLRLHGYVQPIHGKGVRVIWKPDRQARFVLGDIETFHEAAERNNIQVSTGFYSGEDLRTIFHLTYHAKSIAWARKDGYHYDCSRTSRISDLNTKKLRKVYTGYVNSLAEARSFVAEKMPEYLELFDTGKCMTIHNLFLYNSFTFGDKELHGMAKAGIRDILRRYPSLQGSLLDRMKRELKYHYWIARPLIKWYGKCMTVIKGV